jgi:rod shape-determining protein MreC
MQRLLAFLRAFGSILYLLLLQVVGLVLLVQYNQRHGVVFEGTSLAVSGRVQAVRSRMQSHFSREEQNQLLQAENRQLHQQMDDLQRQLKTYQYRPPYLPGKAPLPDSLIPAIDYTYIPCRAIDSRTEGEFNYITLNVGRKHGVRPEMGVVSLGGVAGMVVSVSEHFSRAISLLNRDFRLSARLRKKGVYGSFTWTGGSPRYGLLEHIPLHFAPQPGDTVEASGYSTLFPEGTLVGVIEKVNPNEQTGFHEIAVKLGTDFYRLDYLYLIDPAHKPELDSLAGPSLNPAQPR